jgi:hypothetical protein
MRTDPAVPLWRETALHYLRLPELLPRNNGDGETVTAAAAVQQHQQQQQ